MTELAADEDAIDRVLADWRRERPELDTGAVEVVGRIARAAALIAPTLERNLADHGLSSAGFDLLATLRRAGEPYRLAPRELAARTLKTSGTITARVDRLEADGFVVREADPDDRRGVLVRLTPAGDAALTAAIPFHLALQEEALSGLTARERDQLGGLLRRLLVGIESGADGST